MGRAQLPVFLGICLLLVLSDIFDVQLSGLAAAFAREGDTPDEALAGYMEYGYAHGRHLSQSTCEQTCQSTCQTNCAKCPQSGCGDECKYCDSTTNGACVNRPDKAPCNSGLGGCKAGVCMKCNMTLCGECKYCNATTQGACVNLPAKTPCNGGQGGCTATGTCTKCPDTCGDACKYCNATTGGVCASMPDNTACGVAGSAFCKTGKCQTCPSGGCNSTCQYCDATTSFACKIKAAKAACTNGNASGICTATGTCQICPANGCGGDCKVCDQSTGYVCANKTDNAVCGTNAFCKAGACQQCPSGGCGSACQYCNANTNFQCVNRPDGYNCSDYTNPYGPASGCLAGVCKTCPYQCGSNFYTASCAACNLATGYVCKNLTDGALCNQNPVGWTCKNNLCQVDGTGKEDNLVYVQANQSHTGCSNLCASQTIDVTKRNRVQVVTGSRSVCAIYSAADKKYYEGVEAELQGWQDQLGWYCLGLIKNATAAGKIIPYLAGTWAPGYFCACANESTTTWTAGASGTCTAPLKAKPICWAEVNGTAYAGWTDTASSTDCNICPTCTDLFTFTSPAYYTNWTRPPAAKTFNRLCAA